MRSRRSRSATAETPPDDKTSTKISAETKKAAEKKIRRKTSAEKKVTEKKSAEKKDVKKDDVKKQDAKKDPKKDLKQDAKKDSKQAPNKTSAERDDKDANKAHTDKKADKMPPGGQAVAPRQAGRTVSRRHTRPSRWRPAA